MTAPQHQKPLLVTGAAGFIGSHLAETLCAQGFTVRGLDNLSLGNRNNLKWAGATPSFQLVDGDISDRNAVKRAMNDCRWVFHLAASPSVPRSIQEPLRSHQDNLTGTLTILEVARDIGVERVVFASSSAIYGEQKVEPKDESLEAHPITPYGLQKYAGERYGQMFTEFHDLDTVSLRYFNVFGPRQSFDSPYSGVIARFCDAALREETPIVFGDGLQTRDFTYVDNVVHANIAAAQAPAEKVRGRVFNAATGGSVTLLDILETLGELTGRRIQPEFRPERAGDIRSSKADIRRAQEAFGIRTLVDWREGLRRTLDFYRSLT